MLKNYSFLFILLLSSTISLAQVGIGTTTPHTSAMLELNSSDKGLLIPSMTQIQKNSIVSPTVGLLIFQTDASSGFWYYNGTAWVQLQSQGWSLNGNIGTNSTINFLGTSDNNNLNIATNNIERITVSNNQNVGINQNNPSERLHISGTAPALRIVDGGEAIDKVLTADANGIATWQTKSITGFVPDNDWILQNGNNTGFTNASFLKHTGKVTIGSNQPTDFSPSMPVTWIYNSYPAYLDIDNGFTTGSTFGIGNTEAIIDGNNETQIQANIYPFNTGLKILGGIANAMLAPNNHGNQRWKDVYATNGSIQRLGGAAKANSKPLNYGINEIMLLNPISFYWKEEKHNNIPIPKYNYEKKLGFIAQEVQQIIPEVVYADSWVPKSENTPNEYELKEHKYLGINYEELIMVLINAKKQQDKEIKKIAAETQKLLEKLTK